MKVDYRPYGRLVIAHEMLKKLMLVGHAWYLLLIVKNTRWWLNKILSQRDAKPRDETDRQSDDEF